MARNWHQAKTPVKSKSHHPPLVCEERVTSCALALSAIIGKMIIAKIITKLLTTSVTSAKSIVLSRYLGAKDREASIIGRVCRAIFVPSKIPNFGCFWLLLPTRSNFFGSKWLEKVSCI